MHNLFITVDTGEMQSFDGVLDRLKKAGLEVRHANALLGVITGSVDPAKLADIKQVAGVQSVEEGREL